MFIVFPTLIKQIIIIYLKVHVWLVEGKEGCQKRPAFIIFYPNIWGVLLFLHCYYKLLGYCYKSRVSNLWPIDYSLFIDPPVAEHYLLKLV